MNLSEIKKQDWIILYTMMPVVALGINFILFGKRFFSDRDTFIWGSLAASVIAFLTWAVHTWTLIFVRKKLDKLYKKQLQVVYTFVILMLLTMTIVVSVCWIYHTTHFLGFVLDTKTFLILLSFGLVMNIIATSFNEGAFISDDINKASLETERLKREALQRELDNLKSQVNPHFLFNSLNSLSSLISEDPTQAEEYVNEMSKVYRYFLQVNNVKLVTLEEELKFIQAYYNLLKTRYGKGISLNIHIDLVVVKYMIPPMTLQLLLENAVKHNKVLKDAPLAITISLNENSWLQVENNLQPKPANLHSNGIGLQNISDKYKLMDCDDIIIEKANSFFRVSVPLIKPEVQEEVY